MVPSLQHGIHRRHDDCHPSMHAVPMPQGSSSSWLGLMDNQTSPITLSSYQNKQYLIGLDKLMARVFVSRRQALEN